MVRMTNNSMQLVDSFNLPGDTAASSPKHPGRKKSPRKSKLSNVLSPPLKEEATEDPLKRPLQVLPSQNARSWPRLAPSSPKPQLARPNPALSRPVPTLLPSPTFAEPEQRLEPGLYHNADTGQAFAVDNDMINAAETLVSIRQHVTAVVEWAATAERSPKSIFCRSPVRSGVTPRANTYRSPGQVQPSITTPENIQRSPYNDWREGDARREIVDSGLSPRARRLQAIQNGMFWDRDSYMTVGRIQSPSSAAPTTRADRYTRGGRKKTWSIMGATLPPRRVEPDSDDEGEEDIDADATETDDSAPSSESTEEESDLDDPDYTASSPLKLYSSPPSQPATATKASTARRGRTRQAMHTTPMSQSSDDEMRPGSPIRPPTSPLSQTPSRTASRNMTDKNDVSPSYATPPASTIPTPPLLDTPQQLEKWQQKARETQFHRRTESLESFMEKSKEKFYELKNADDDDESLPDVDSLLPDAKANKLLEDPEEMNMNMTTPASDGIEEGEIIDDAASDVTMIVSPTKQRQIKSEIRDLTELNY